MSTTTDDVTHKRVSALLGLVAKKEKILNPEYDVAHTIKIGDGYLSVIYDARIRDNDEEVLSVVVKIALEDQIFRKQWDVRSLFENETLFYDKIYPAFCKFQNEKGIEEIFYCAPKCYVTTMEEENECLVLENIRDKGYKLWDKTVPMDENHVELTLRTYAKYHALNFAFKDQHKEEYDYFRSRMKNTLEKITDNLSHEQENEKLLKSTINYLDPVEDKGHIEKFRDHIQSTKSQRKLFYDDSLDEYSIIRHGDCWCNNMMYKYDDPTDPTRPTKVRLLDFQIIPYSAPVIDFAHYFYTSSSKKVLDNIEYYLNIYYDTLADFVRQLGSDPEKVYPRSVFDAQWKKYSVYGLYVAIFQIKVMTSEPDEIPDFLNSTKNESTTNPIEYKPKNSGYKKRIRDVIVHFCEKGLI